MHSSQPTPEQAAAAAEATTGQKPVAITRFTTGVAHHVFEAAFEDGRSIVVRMGYPAQRAEVVGGVQLNGLLRPLGVPLPAILQVEVDASFPWVTFERLPGTDLKHVVDQLTEAQLGAVAAGVAAAQAATARLGSAGRYGYAVRPGDARCARWSEVLDTHLARSQKRIKSAQLFRAEPLDELASLLEARRAELDALSATAFLHDTTVKNVIIDGGGKLSGIVDVDDLCFGDPRYTPALTLAALQAYGGPTAYVDAWMREAGHEDDGLFRLYVALFLADLMSEHGQRFNGNEPATNAQSRAVLFDAFAQAVERANH